MSDAMDVDVDVGPLEIRFQPGKLWDLAAVSLGAALLRYKITYVRRNGAKGAKINALELAHVSVPTSLRKTIDEVYCNVEKSWMSWWYYHHRRIFLQQPSPDSMIDWLDHMIWLPDGTINYEQTAKMILFNDMLTKVQKFQLACAYCFMDDVERLKSELKREEIRHACLERNQIDDGFSNYWRDRGRIQNAPIFGFQVDEERSSPENILSFLLSELHTSNTLERYDEWSAIEFWFNKCHHGDLWNKVRKIVIDGSPRVIFHILVKLTAFELNSMISEHCFDIFQALVKKPNKYTILIWKYVVHGIRDVDLSHILRHLNDYQFYERKYVNSLLLEMWLCTSERQKKYIINERVCDFTRKNPSSSEIEKFPPNFPLILDFLSHCDLERKYEYWSENWPYLVIPQFGSENRTIIDRIMKLCLVDDQKIEDFKKAKMTEYDRIADYCKWFIENDRINAIQSYLEFCTSDLQLIRDSKKKIITGISHYTIFNILFRGSDEKKRDLFQYLDEVFTENESKEFLNRIVTLPDTLRQFCYMTSNVTSQELENMIEILEKYVSSEQNLFKAKQYIYKQCFGRTKIPIFLDLTRWCLNVDKLVVENFKESESDLNTNVGLFRGGLRCTNVGYATGPNAELFNGNLRGLEDSPFSFSFGSSGPIVRESNDNTNVRVFKRGINSGSFNQARIIMESELNDGRLNEGSIVVESNDQMRNSGHYIFDIFMSPYIALAYIF